MKIFDGRLQTPFTCIISGPPQSGKTHFIIQLMRNRDRLIDKTFDALYWVYGQDNSFVRSLNNNTFGLPTTLIHTLPDSFDEYIKKSKRPLFVIDDLMSSASESTIITDLFCNKVQHANISVILNLQNIFYHGKERTTLLRCTHYLVIFKNPMDNSVPLYLASRLMPLNRKLFMNMFETATSKSHSYLFCDGKQSTPDEARYRTDIFNRGVQRVFIIQHGADKTRYLQDDTRKQHEQVDTRKQTNSKDEEEKER